MNYQSESEKQELTSWEVPEVMATVGPTLEKPDDLCRAIEEGARWFRFPCGYRQRPHVENARAVRAAAARTGISVQLLLDLPSSRPRTGPMEELRLAVGDRVVIWDSETSSHPPSSQNGCATVPLPGLDELQAKLAPKHGLWFCDGRLRFVVEEVNGSYVVARMVEGTAPLKSSNSLFLPDSPSPFAPITPLDLALLRAFATADLRPEWVALSLIACPEDVWLARQQAGKILGPDFRVMAKFETMAAVQCAETIIAQSDGLMVARGDLALAVGYIRVPEVQEHLVAAARKAGKVSVVATQVLEGFAETGLPQRPELSDLSLIARQRAGAVMLGKETVYSPRPIECIRLAVEVLTHETKRFEAESRPPRSRGQRRACAGP